MLLVFAVMFSFMVVLTIEMMMIDMMAKKAITIRINGPSINWIIPVNRVVIVDNRRTMADRG
jgi:hypothetical protein